MADIKRQTAVKCTISEILNGRYVQQQGLEPNYVDIKGTQAGRVNVLATVVLQENETFTLDDGTDKIDARIFTDAPGLRRPLVGEIVVVIGRPREYSQKRYIAAEIIRKIENPSWVKLRKKELGGLQNNQTTHIVEQPKREESKPIIEEPEAESATNYSAVLIKTIRQLDTGNGADIDKVIEESNLPNAERQIQTLLNEGEIFEFRPGKLKLLE